MTDKTLDPTEFAERLARSFDAEPGHASFEDDLAVARRRLRRHRVTTSLGGAAVAAVAATALLVVPGVLPRPAADLQVASAPRTDADVVRDCVSYNDHAAAGGSLPDSIDRADVERMMGRAELMTRAGDEQNTVATVRSEDGKVWLECSLWSWPGEPLKVFSLAYPTDVPTTRKTVDGVLAYAPHAENDPRTWGTGSGDWQMQPACRITEPEETQAANDAAAACPRYRLSWNGRRVPEVAKVLVRTPEGKEVEADVRDGYLSLDVTLDMSPVVAAAFEKGRQPDLQRIVFMDRDGNVLADQPDVFDPRSKQLSIYNWPSLAWWTKD